MLYYKYTLINNDKKNFLSLFIIIKIMKIALLLMTIDNPFFMDNIKKYLNDNIKLYIHAKFPEKLNKFFEQYLIKK